MPPADTLRARVERALSGVQNPRVAQNVVTAGMVHDLAVDDRGQVTFTFLLSAEDPGTLARDARKAVQAVAGVTGVKITVAGGGAPARGPGADPARRDGVSPPAR